MKAMVYKKYGPPEVLKLEEIEKPTPKDDEVLIKIYAATVTAGDCEIRKFDITPLFWLPVRLFMGIFKPRIQILGQEFAGQIEEVGKNVNGYKVGDKVFGSSGMGMGAYAEYKCITPINLGKIPNNIGFEEAATIPTGGLNAIYFLKKANIKSGDKVLINGAGGSIGSYGIQYAKSLGAEVTVVDSSDKLEVLKSIGADYLIDYKKENFRKNGKSYDIIFDIISRSISAINLKSLNKNCIYLFANPNLACLIYSLWTSIFTDKKIITGLANESEKECNFVMNLIESGKITPLIDRKYKLENLVKAHEYVESGAKTGNVVISI